MGSDHETPSVSGPCRVLEFDEKKCVGCNLCVEACPLDVMSPNPEQGKPPVVTFAEECWFCGGCVQECPNGAVKLLPPLQPHQKAPFKRKHHDG